MSASTWIAIALAAVYLPAGLVKVLVPKSRLVTNAQFGWAADVSDSAVKAIGVAEILGALGIAGAKFAGITPMLGIAAAWGLAALQLGAIIVHVRRREFATLPINAVLVVLAVILAAGVV